MAGYVDARRRSRVVRSASKFASVPGNWLARRLASCEGAVRAAPSGSLRGGACAGRSPILTVPGERACEQAGSRRRRLVVARVAAAGACIRVSDLVDFFFAGFFFLSACSPVGES